MGHIVVYATIQIIQFNNHLIFVLFFVWRIIMCKEQKNNFNAVKFEENP